MPFKSKEKRKEYDKNRYEEHKEYFEEHRKKYYEEHKEEYKLYREKHRAEERNQRQKYRNETKTKCFSLLGKKCVRCGNDNLRVLQIDHIIPIGNKNRTYRDTGTALYRKIIEEIESGNPHNYQLLCANCNWEKREEDIQYKKRN